MRYLFKHVESMHLIDTAIIHNEIHFDKLKKVKTTLIPPFFFNFLSANDNYDVN